MNDLTNIGTMLTMSSREIAALTGKNHNHVTRDIESMLEELGLDVSSFGRIYLDSRNRKQKEAALPKDLTLTLVSGYNVKLRKRIIDRWIELEGQEHPRHQIPQTLSEALRYAACPNDPAMTFPSLALIESSIFDHCCIMARRSSTYVARL